MPIIIRKNFTGRVAVPAPEPGQSMTKQASANECCINQIMARFHKTGLLPQPMSERKASYGDFTQITDYHQAQSMVAEARQTFNDLPSNIRSYFKNDPELLIEFLDDPDNEAKAVKLGLTNPKVVIEKPDKPKPKPVVPTVPAPGPGPEPTEPTPDPTPNA